MNAIIHKLVCQVNIQMNFESWCARIGRAKSQRRPNSTNKRLHENKSNYILCDGVCVVCRNCQFISRRIYFRYIFFRFLSLSLCLSACLFVSFSLYSFHSWYLLTRFFFYLILLLFFYIFPPFSPPFSPPFLRFLVVVVSRVSSVCAAIIYFGLFPFYLFYFASSSLAPWLCWRI